MINNDTVMTNYAYLGLMGQIWSKPPKRLADKKINKAIKVINAMTNIDRIKAIGILKLQKELQMAMNSALYTQKQKQYVAQAKAEGKKVIMVPGAKDGLTRSWKSVKTRFKLYAKDMVEGTYTITTEKLLGITKAEYKAYMEAQFKDGMTWDNYAVLWNNDHIKAISKAKNIKELLELSKYTNIKPMLIEENCEKGNQ